VLDGSNRVIEIMQSLTKKNFPETDLVIDDDGSIELKENSD
jgi:hypothetical protein